MQLTVEKIKPTAKSIVVTAGGKEYFAKKESGITAGMTIEAETEDSEYNGKNYCWIKKWKAMASTTATAASAAPAAPSGNAWLPFASNTVAHAINAGLIQSPDQVKLWAAAAKQAYQELA
jgi:hypothetical protein